MGEIIIRKVKGMNWKAKVSLMLIFTLVFSTFMYHGWYKPKFSEAVATGDGQIVYGEGVTTARYRDYTALTNTFGAEGNAGAAAANNTVVFKIVSSPTRNEHIMGYVTTAGTLYIKRWTGAAWVDDFSLAVGVPGGNGTNGRRFDLAYENVTGNCMLVYSNNTTGANEMRYMYYTSATQTWGGATNLDSARITGTPIWVKMESRPGTNEIAAIISDSNSDLTALIWTGTWGGEPTAALTQNLEIVAAAGDVDCFDLAYESLTGDLLIVWADAAGANGTNGVRYATRSAAGTWSGSLPGGLTPGTFADDATNLDLASDPLSDYILFASIGNAGSDLQAGAWDGTAWVNNTANVDSSAFTPVAGSHAVSCGWLKSGGTERGIIVYSDGAPLTNGTVDFYSYTKGTGFTVGADYTYNSTGGTAVTERQIEVGKDPFNTDRLLVVFSDSQSDLWAKRLVMDATPAFTWTDTEGGAALTATLTGITAQAFSYAYDRYVPPNVQVSGLASYPPPGTVQQGDQNVAMLKFQLAAISGTETWTGGKLDKIGTNGNLGDVTFDIYKDTANNGTFDIATDTLIGSGSFSAATGQTYTLTTNQTLTTTAQWYFIVYDIAVTAQTGTTVGARIVDNTYFTIQSGVPVTGVASTSSGTPTINAGTCTRSAPTVTLSPSSATINPGDSKVYTVTIQNNDNVFCSNSTFTLSIPSETGSTGSFNLPSVLGSTSTGSLLYNGTYNTTLTVSSKTSAADGDALTSTVMARDTTNHSGQDGTGSVTTSTRNFLLHNSATTGSSYWAGNGGWGITGAKYGQFVCQTCHEPRATNIKGVKSTISTPDATNWASNSSPNVAVNFQSTTTPNGFGDDTALHTTSQKICEVCHSQTAYHKYNQAAATHGNNIDCASACHKHNIAFTGDGPCLDCHNAAQSQLYNTRNVSTDFTRLSRHVSDGTATNILTNYDCIVCHAEGDASKVAAGTGWLDKTKHKNGTTSNGTPATDRVVKLRNVDNYSQSYDWNKKLTTGSYTAGQRTTMRDNMDTFCMNCHDSNGASAVSVNNANPATGLFLNDTTTIRGATGKTVNLRPFNVNDTLQNGNDTSKGQGTTIGTFRTTNNGRVVNVKDQFNSTNAVGKNWGSHHNLNQFTKRYSTNNTTYWPAAAWTAYVTKEGVDLNTGASTTAGLHCSDCHLNETNAHGSTNAWYMLQDKSGNITPGSEPDTAPTTTGTSSTTHQIMCFRCHSSATYAGDATSATNSRYLHTDDCAGSSVNNSRNEFVFGMACLVCHGGFGDTAQVASGGLGAIHGTNETYYPGNGATASKRYRFMSGGTMRFYRPDNAAYTAETQWENTGVASRCYTIGSSDTWSGTCTQHSSGVAIPTNLQRSRLLDY